MGLIEYRRWGRGAGGGVGGSFRRGDGYRNREFEGFIGGRLKNKEKDGRKNFRFGNTLLFGGT